LPAVGVAEPDEAERDYASRTASPSELRERREHGGLAEQLNAWDSTQGADSSWDEAEWDEAEWDEAEWDDHSSPSATPVAPVRRRQTTAARPLAKRTHGGPHPRPLEPERGVARPNAYTRALDVILIPGRQLSRFLPQHLRSPLAQAIDRLSAPVPRRLLVTLLLLTIFTSTVLTATGTFQAIGTWSQGAWASLSGAVAVETQTARATATAVARRQPSIQEAPGTFMTTDGKQFIYQGNAVKLYGFTFYPAIAGGT